MVAVGLLAQLTKRVVAQFSLLNSIWEQRLVKFFQIVRPCWIVSGVVTTFLVAESFFPERGAIASLLPPVSHVQHRILQQILPPKPVDEFVDVIVVGQGIDPEKALRDAFKNAVQEAVGLVLGSEMVVENDEIVKDRILTYSDGYISDYQVLERSKEGAICVARIRATVRQEKLVIRLHDFNVALTNVSGEKIHAMVRTQRKRREEALAMLGRRTSGFPRNVIRIEIPDNLRPEDVTPDTDSESVTLHYQKKLSIDVTGYNTFIKSLMELLDQVASEKDEIQLAASASQLVEETRSGHGGLLKYCDSHEALFGEGSKFNRSSNGDGDELRQLFICVDRDALNQRTIWKRYTVEKVFFDRIKKSIDSLLKPMVIRTRFVSRSGSVLSADEYAQINGENSRRIKWFPGVAAFGDKALVLGPYFIQESPTRYWLTTEIHGKIPFAVDAIKDVATISGEISFEDAAN